MKPPEEKSPSVFPPRAKKTDEAFDLWLHRSLHQLYDSVAREPIPEELMKLIEEDRNK
jgi:hypothetical protein